MFRLYPTGWLAAGLWLGLAVAWAEPAQAQETGPRKLTLTPARPPSPVLRFALLPELRDQVPGDGAPLYKKAGELLQKIPGRMQHGLWFDQWSQMPLADLPRDEVRKVLELYQEPLALFEKAGRCESCEWGLSQQLREKGISTLLPEVHQMREGFEVLRTRARLELLDGRPERALRTLQTMYQLSRNVAESPTLISCLVAVAIAVRANGVLEEVLAHPQTPNLYWSLTSLPRPFVDLRKAFQGERLMVYGTFPGTLAVAADPEAGPIKPEHIQTLVKMALGLEEKSDNYLNRAQLALLIQSKHEVAKRALIAAGRPRAKVESWPHLQVALMHSLLEYDQLFDEMLKWQSLPFPEAQPELEKADKRRLAARPQIRGADAPALSLAGQLLPRVNKIVLAQHRLDRHFAALRCLEAIRLYAANHEGKLPPTLADIKEVPIPLCPITGKPFVYRLQGDRATLDAPEVSVKYDKAPPLAYELTLKR